jgi:hypothetical protein
MEYDKKTINEAIETLVEADDIQNDPDLMKAIEPELKKKAARMMKVLELKDLWKKGLAEASEEEYKDAQKKEELLSEKMKEKLKIKGDSPLKDEQPNIPKSG